jgi:dienelactone hydrolase
MLPGAIFVIAFAIGIGRPQASAAETGAEIISEEHRVEFYNQDVKLAGSLLLPRSESPLPAVVFVHGAGRQNREPYREVGEFFASQGIAALIYDKRGTGQSSGVYESHEPYENLVNDARSAIAFLKQRPEVAQSQIGIWGLSQGAYISAAAASRTDDIRFIITVGASVADGMMFYYRDNLFRRYELSDTLRDVAEKAHLAIYSLPHNLPDGFGLSSFAPRSYPPTDEYVHPAWSRVNQPVLAMWGEMDQHVPVGESVAGLKNSLAHANNQQWTVIILPRANHDLRISETGELHRDWRGYPPGALNTMTNWARSVIDHPSDIDKMKQEGVAREAGVLSRLADYESLRWYGNGIVQAALWILFFLFFLTQTTIAIWHCTIRLIGRSSEAASPGLDWSAGLKRVVCALNLLIVVAFTITVLLVVDQMRPSCPSVLLFLPLLGTVSMLATVALLIVHARTRSDHDWTIARKIRSSIEFLCLILFVPFMLYWNLIGYLF